MRQLAPEKKGGKKDGEKEEKNDGEKEGKKVEDAASPPSGGSTGNTTHSQVSRAGAGAGAETEAGMPSHPPLNIDFWTVSRPRYTVLMTMKEAFGQYTRVGISENDLEEVKDFMTRQPLSVLAAIQIISMLQMWLSMMAFKNDISFFKGRSDYAGLSSRTLITDAAHSSVIFLYLYDYENMSRIVLFQCGIGALIALWKVHKRMRLRVTWSYFLPWLSSATQAEMSAGERATEDIDVRLMRYMKWVMYPLSAVWGIYCLYHYQYSSWWSWFISSLADFAYSFGFVNMMPQIFVNYKLKSVAHLPWRVFFYKAFNTFVDDIFAWFIMGDQMTKKHRFMTLRDDVVFLVFLYQLWLYPVDKTRADEYGYVYDDPRNLLQDQSADGGKDEAGETKAKKEAKEAKEAAPTAPRGQGPGATVDTVYGPGEVVEWRAGGIVVVEFAFGQGYLSSTAIVVAAAASAGSAKTFTVLLSKKTQDLLGFTDHNHAKETMDHLEVASTETDVDTGLVRLYFADKKHRVDAMAWIKSETAEATEKDEAKRSKRSKSEETMQAFEHMGKGRESRLWVSQDTQHLVGMGHHAEAAEMLKDMHSTGSTKNVADGKICVYFATQSHLDVAVEWIVERRSKAIIAHRHQCCAWPFCRRPVMAAVEAKIQAEEVKRVEDVGVALKIQCAHRGRVAWKELDTRSTALTTRLLKSAKKHEKRSDLVTALEKREEAQRHMHSLHGTDDHRSIPNTAHVARLNTLLAAIALELKEACEREGAAERDLADATGQVQEQTKGRSASISTHAEETFGTDPVALQGHMERAQRMLAAAAAKYPAYLERREEEHMTLRIALGDGISALSLYRQALTVSKRSSAKAAAWRQVLDPIPSAIEEWQEALDIGGRPMGEDDPRCVAVVERMEVAAARLASARVLFEACMATKIQSDIRGIWGRGQLMNDTGSCVMCGSRRFLELGFTADQTDVLDVYDVEQHRWLSTSGYAKARSIGFARACFNGALKANGRGEVKGAEGSENPSLGKEEVKKWFKTHPEEKKHIVGLGFTWVSFFTRMDQDGDGMLDLEEFTAAIMVQYHDELTEDGDHGDAAKIHGGFHCSSCWVDYTTKIGKKKDFAAIKLQCAARRRSARGQLDAKRAALAALQAVENGAASKVQAVVRGRQYRVRHGIAGLMQLSKESESARDLIEAHRLLVEASGMMHGVHGEEDPRAKKVARDVTRLDKLITGIKDAIEYAVGKARGAGEAVISLKAEEDIAAEMAAAQAKASLEKAGSRNRRRSVKDMAESVETRVRAQSKVGAKRGQYTAGGNAWALSATTGPWTLGELEASMKELGEVMAKFPEYLDREEATAITIHDTQGDCFSAKRDYDPAIEAWNAALEIGQRPFGDDDPRCVEGGLIESKIEAEGGKIVSRAHGIKAYAAAVKISARYRGRMQRRRFRMQASLTLAAHHEDARDLVKALLCTEEAVVASEYFAGADAARHQRAVDDAERLRFAVTEIEDLILEVVKDARGTREALEAHDGAALRANPSHDAHATSAVPKRSDDTDEESGSEDSDALHRGVCDYPTALHRVLGSTEELRDLAHTFTILLENRPSLHMTVLIEIGDCNGALWKGHAAIAAWADALDVGAAPLDGSRVDDPRCAETDAKIEAEEARIVESTHAATRVQALYRTNTAQRRVQQVRETKNGAAVRIQAHHRRRGATARVEERRRLYAELKAKEAEDAATAIQSRVRGRQHRARHTVASLLRSAKEHEKADDLIMALELLSEALQKLGNMHGDTMHREEDPRCAHVSKDVDRLTAQLDTIKDLLAADIKDVADITDQIVACRASGQSMEDDEFVIMVIEMDKAMKTLEAVQGKYAVFLDREEATAITIHDTQGDCFSAKHDYDLAIEAWNAALEIGQRPFGEDDPRCVEGGLIEDKIAAEEHKVAGAEGWAAARIQSRYRGVSARAMLATSTEVCHTCSVRAFKDAGHMIGSIRDGEYCLERHLFSKVGIHTKDDRAGALARAVFEGADKNGDGSLTRREILKFLFASPVEKGALAPTDDFDWENWFTEMVRLSQSTRVLLVVTMLAAGFLTGVG